MHGPWGPCWGKQPGRRLGLETVLSCMRLAGRACHGARDVLNRMRVRWCAWAVLNLANHIKKNTRVIRVHGRRPICTGLRNFTRVYLRCHRAPKSERAPQSTTKEKASQSTTKRIGVKESTVKPHVAPSKPGKAHDRAPQGNTEQDRPNRAPHRTTNHRVPRLT